MTMSPRLSVMAAASAAVALASLGFAPTATADDGRGAEATKSAAAKAAPRAAVAESAPAADAGSSSAVEMPTSYPYEPSLTIYQDNPNDGAAAAELLGHDDLAPMLMDMMERSNRLSVQVVGQSTLGRDLYLATVTAPENAEQTAQQTAWREQIKADPEGAAADEELQAGYKTPIWISNNIHGNEWEGTDAAMTTIEDIVDAPWSEVSALLREHRLYFSLSLNPDGRTLSTRATSLGLDPNRDMITNKTPETVSFIRTAHAIQPMYAADFHGYTNVLQIEPCGPPHGENYEYDLFLPQAYALALAVEEDVVAADIPGNTYFNVDTRRVVAANTGPESAHIKIPYRDTPSGWDDYPPIFTAQYAAFFGASTSTVELPLTRGGAGGTQSPGRAVVNQAVAEQTMTSMIDYFHENSDAFMDNQIEAFRRGLAGEPKISLTAENIADVPGPDQWKSIWNGEEGREDDQDPVVLPRAYVIPVGDDQRSASDARRLVDQLVMHDVEVGVLDADAAIGGTTYPAGSYVVDMHQPLRGLANSLLDLGTDISDKVPSMYDISAWSYSYTWGATVDKTGLTQDGPLPSYTPVDGAQPAADLPAQGSYLTFDLAGVSDFAALDDLLGEGVAVSMLPDGSAVVAPGDHAALAAIADEYELDVAEASAEDVAALADEDTKALDDLSVAYVGSQDDRLSLQELGFEDAVAVTATTANTDPTLVTNADILWVGSSFNVNDTTRAAIQAWVDAGHSIVGRTNQAFNVAASYGLVSGTVVNGNGSGNGIVAVDTPEDSVLAPYAQDYSFIYPAYWFTGLGEGTVAAQTYDAEDPFLAGHWRPSGAGVNGPANSAGMASVISGETESGARSVVFGTSVFFRTHPKGGLSQAARALYWAGPEGTAVAEPGASSIEVVAPETITYPETVTVEVGVTSDAGTPEGTVELLAGAEVVASGELVDGEASIEVTGLLPGTTTLSAAFVPASGAFEAAESATFDVTVAKAPASVGLKAKKAGKVGKKGAKTKVEATVTVSVPGVSPALPVIVKDGARTIRTFTAPESGKRTITFAVGKGKHAIKVVVPGTDLTTRAVSKVVTFRTK